MQVAERGDIGVVVRRDRDGVADGEAVELAARAPVPRRLVGLAQARQIETKRLTLFIGDAMLPDP